MCLPLPLQRTNGACLSEISTERMRDTSLACLLDLGLKSQSRATRSHSVPGEDSSTSFTKASSAALKAMQHYIQFQEHTFPPPNPERFSRFLLFKNFQGGRNLEVFPRLPRPSNPELPDEGRSGSSWAHMSYVKWWNTGVWFKWYLS